MADNSIAEFSGVVIDTVQPSSPWQGLIWVDPTPGANKTSIYYENTFIRIDAAVIDTTKFMPVDADANTAGNLSADLAITAATTVNAGAEVTAGTTVNIQDGAPLGKITLTTTVGQPAGGAEGDIVMVHN